jgi:hypothetical protein
LSASFNKLNVQSPEFIPDSHSSFSSSNGDINMTFNSEWAGQSKDSDSSFTQGWSTTEVQNKKATQSNAVSSTKANKNQPSSEKKQP